MVSFDLNATIGPIIDGVTNLIPSIMNLVVAIVPLLILFAVVDFILELLGVGILGRLGKRV
jgi:hypothetical protein